MNCNDLTPLDIIRWRGVRAIWRRQDFKIIGDRIRVPVTITAAGVSLQISKAGGAIFQDPNVAAYISSTDAKGWMMFSGIKLNVKGKELQPFGALADALDAATLNHTPLGSTAYIESLGIDAVGSDFAIPSYGPGAVAQVGSPVALQPGWRNLPGWTPVDLESDSLILTIPASAGLVTTQGFLDFRAWAIAKENVRDAAVRFGPGALSQHFRDIKQTAQERLRLMTAPR